MEHCRERLKDTGGLNLKALFNITGGSFFYCLSGLFILYGAARILNSFQGSGGILGEALACIAVLNIYEIALLGILLMIVLWRNVTDDAVSLLVLIALFIVGSGIALTCVSTSRPWLTILIGMLSMGLAAGKLYALRRFVRFRLSASIALGLSIILAMNFLIGGTLGVRFNDLTAADPTLRPVWLLGWIVFLVGAAVILAVALHRKGKYSRKTEQPAFIRTRSMMWIFLLIIMAATGIHQTATAYLFDIEFAFGDFLPLISILFFMLLVLAHSLKSDSRAWRVTVALAPLGFVLGTVFSGKIIAPSSWGIGLLWHPSIILTANAAILFWMGRQYRQHELQVLALIYLLPAMLMSGVDLPDPLALNWMLCGYAITAALFLVGIFRRQPGICWTGIVSLGFLLGMGNLAEPYANQFGLGTAGYMAGIVGLGTAITGLIFGRKMPSGLLIAGLSGLVLFAIDYMPLSVGFQDFAVMTVLGILGTVLWARRGDLRAIGVLGLVPLYRIGVIFFMIGSHWRYIAASFVLLIVGAGVSIIKGKGENHG